jgi:hypothetical protein
MTIYEVVEFLTSDEVNGFFLPFKILAVLVALAFIYGANYYYRKQELSILDWRRKYNHFFHMTTPPDSKTVPERFQEILNFLNKKNQLDTKMALIKNQYLIEDILKKLEIPMEVIDDTPEEKLPDAATYRLLSEIADKVKKDPSYDVNIEMVRKLFISMRDSLLKIGMI